MKSDNGLIKTLERVGALILNDHVVLTSGNHSEIYINKDALMPHTKEMSKLGKRMAELFVDNDVEVVVGPATAGIVIAQWTAHHLSLLTGKEVLATYTDKTLEGEEKRQEFKRGYDALVRDKRVLIVEDITATGSSIDKVVSSVRKLTKDLVGIGVIVNRDPKRINDETWGVPFESLEVFEAVSYPQDECPMCKKGVPINTTVGHGREFLGEVRMKS